VLKIRSAFASFSTDDVHKAKEFYGRKLGLEVRDNPMGFLEVVLGADQHVMVYPKPNHEPATFTVLNFIVHDIEAAVGDLKGVDVDMERYPQSDQMQQDEKGIARDPQGPAIAWFKDNAGNILSVIEDTSVGE
jgi:catechol 2,3-dioxygenase-like lactoylglutathione lyase family enzyme